MKSKIIASSVFAIGLMCSTQALSQEENSGGLSETEFNALTASEGYQAMIKLAPLAADSPEEEEKLSEMIQMAKAARENFVTDIIDPNEIYDVVIQAGHVPRRKGATGSTGQHIVEQEGNALIAELLRPMLEAQQMNFRIIDADSFEKGPKVDGTHYIKTNIFLSLHLDGSRKPCASSASLGYNDRTIENGRQNMQLLGFGLAIALDLKAQDFMRDNFTKNLSHYGDYGKIDSKIAEGILEMSELSCPDDEKNFLLSAEIIAKNIDTAISFMLKEK
ncbi:MAG: N-acetylmuramoyl-L-alanine amidase [Pseudomonadota bacterium]